MTRILFALRFAVSGFRAGWQLWGEIRSGVEFADEEVPEGERVH